MTFDERTYKTLVVSSSEKFNENLASLLPAAQCEPVTYTDSIASARRMCLENSFDLVLVNTPLPDELGSKFAVDISAGKKTICLIFVRSELYSELKSKVTPYGVFTLPKPTSASAISLALGFLTSARERLRGLERKTLSIEEKMEEIRVINRAKWLLIDHRQMAEPDAHRYIEKQAMDTGSTKLDIAKEIISMYAE